MSERTPFVFQPDHHRNSIPKPSLESIQQQRLLIDYQLELSKIKHEMQTYQKHALRLEDELEERHQREDREQRKHEHQIQLLTEQMHSCNQVRIQLKEELFHTMGLLDEERRMKLQLMDELVSKDNQLAELQGTLRKRESTEHYKKEEQQMSNKKILEEELNKYKNEIQFKFAKKEQRYQQTIHKLQKELGQDTQVFQQSSQSMRWTKPDVLQHLNQDQEQNPLLLKVMQLTQSNAMDECLTNLENIMAELAAYGQLTLKLAQKCRVQVEQPSSRVLGQLLEKVTPKDSKQVVDSRPKSNGVNGSEKFLKQLQYFLGVSHPEQIIPAFSEQYMEFKGNERIVKTIQRYLDVPDQESLVDLEQELYNRLGMQ